MTNANKRSSSVFRVDEKVYLTMGAVCILSVIILAFRYGTSHPCYPIKIETSSNSFRAGSPVNMRAETKEGKTFDWNFGDGTSSLEYDPATFHSYTHAGKYTVTCAVDGLCTEMAIVVIDEAPFIANSGMPNIRVSDTIYVNRPTVFQDISINSTSWEWSFGDTSTVDARTRNPSHVFTTAGSKTIYLRVNGRSDLMTFVQIFVVDPRQTAVRQVHQTAPKVITKVIAVDNTPVVQPLPAPPQEEPKPAEEKPVKAPPITDGQMGDMLMQVSGGGKTPQEFGPFLCNNLNMDVRYNGEKMTFTAMCDKIKGIKQKKIKKISVILTKTEATNCITSMDVTLEKQKILGIFNK